jgi:hypothetical protein
MAANGRGGLGWLILAAALAVPGFLFYNWWSHLKAEHDHAISAKASKRADGGVFQTPPPMSGRLINPMAPSTSAAAGFPDPVAGMRPGASTGTAVAAATAAGVTSPAAASIVAAAPAILGTAPSAPPHAAAAIPAPAAVVLSTAATIVLSRDPMMSPLDAVRLREAAQAEADRLAALDAASHPRPQKRHKKPVQSPIETKIELQGIVAKADGDNLAIINGSTINPGETFTVERYEGKVRVVRITSSEVTLEYKGRKIKLSVNAE